MRHVVLFGLAALAVAALPARHSPAQGLLHKQRHVAGPGLAAMRPLPGPASAQASPVAVAATGAVSSAAGSATTAIAAVTANPSLPGTVGGAPGMPPLGIVPPAPPLGGLPIDAVPMPMPSIDGGPPIACIDYPCVIPGFDPGFDPGSTVTVGGWPDALGPPAGMGPGGSLGSVRPRIHHALQGPTTFGPFHGSVSAANAQALQATAFGPSTAGTPPPVRNVAGGLPGRAVGVRPGTLDVPGRRQMAPIGAMAPGSTAASAVDTNRDSAVIQAGGIAPQNDGATRRAGTAAAPPAGPASAAVAAPPRWRDRLRVAWPTVK